MRSIATAVLSLFWFVIGYYGLLQLAKRFFTGRYRAQIASAATVLAFTLGATWPRSEPSAALPMVAVAPVLTMSPEGRTAAIDVGKLCGAAYVGRVVGKGNLDEASVQNGSVVTAATGHAKLHAGDVLIVRGWAADTALMGPATGVCAVVDGKILSDVKVLYGGSRPDVVAAFQNASLVSTGFEFSLPNTRVNAGWHRVQAVALSAGGSGALLSGAVEIVDPGR